MNCETSLAPQIENSLRQSDWIIRPSVHQTVLYGNLKDAKILTIWKKQRRHLILLLQVARVDEPQFVLFNSVFDLSGSTMQVPQFAVRQLHCAKLILVPCIVISWRNSVGHFNTFYFCDTANQNCAWPWRETSEKGKSGHLQPMERPWNKKQLTGWITTRW